MKTTFHSRIVSHQKEELKALLNEIATVNNINLLARLPRLSMASAEGVRRERERERKRSKIMSWQDSSLYLQQDNRGLYPKVWFSLLLRLKPDVVHSFCTAIKESSREASYLFHWRRSRVSNCVCCSPNNNLSIEYWNSCVTN